MAQNKNKNKNKPEPKAEPEAEPVPTHATIDHKVELAVGTVKGSVGRIALLVAMTSVPDELAAEASKLRTASGEAETLAGRCIGWAIKALPGIASDAGWFGKLGVKTDDYAARLVSAHTGQELSRCRSFVRLAFAVIDRKLVDRTDALVSASVGNLNCLAAHADKLSASDLADCIGLLSLPVSAFRKVETLAACIKRRRAEAKTPKAKADKVDKLVKALGGPDGFVGQVTLWLAKNPASAPKLRSFLDNLKSTEAPDVGASKPEPVRKTG